MEGEQLALAPCKGATAIPTSGRLKNIGPLSPSYKHSRSSFLTLLVSPSPSCDQPSSSWHITPLSSPWGFSLNALPPLPPPKPTSSTSSASRLSQLGRFLNRRLRYMRLHPQRVSSSLLPSSPTRLLRILLARKRAQSFVHSCRSTSQQTEA